MGPEGRTFFICCLPKAMVIRTVGNADSQETTHPQEKLRLLGLANVRA